MTKETHSTGGILISLIVINYFINTFLLEYNIFYILFLILIFFYFSYLGSLFPDIDHKRSSISKMFPLLSNILSKHCRHRGFTHSILCLALIGFIFKFIIFISDFNIITLTSSFGFVCGYASHLLLDLTTLEGIEIFYPCKINFKLGKIKTGSKFEKFFNNFLKIINSSLIIYNMYLLSSVLF